MSMLLALRLLWRDWRAGELTLLLASLVIAIGTVTTITLFVDRLHHALLSESAIFLAADRIVSSSKPVPKEWLVEADRLGLSRAETLEFLSMVFAADRAQLSSVKAVSPGYPLRGTLEAADRPFVRGTPVRELPLPGEVWLESRLLPALGIRTGDTLEVGEATFRVGRVLIKEPDRGGGFNAVGPRVLMNLDDVPATRVVQPGSRLSYHYLFAGTTEALERLDRYLAPRLGNDYRLIGVRDSTRGIGNALERAERFLLLGGLLGVILAGVAIALSAQRYSLRHFNHVAILKTLGATPERIDTIFLVIFALVAASAILIGSLVGWLSQLAVARALAPFIPVELPQPGLRPLGVGAMTAIVCLFSFALPPLLKLRKIAPIRVLRRDLDKQSVSARLAYLFGFGGSVLLLWWYSKDLKLTVLILGGASAATVLLGGIAWLLLRSGRVLGMQAGSAWRLALAGMQRRGQENTLQILVFGLAIMLLLILILVRTALIHEWEAQIPRGAPNHFVINIAPEDVVPMRHLLDENHVRSEPLFPMISGRIIKVNGENARDRDRYRRRMDEEGDRMGPRSSSSRNLTWASALPDDNRVVAGKWWPANYDGEPLVSLEKEFADGNGLKLGDRLTFSIRDREVEARVASIRTVSWDNMRPNFFIIFTKNALEGFPSTYMTSFFLEPDRKMFLNELLGRYPTVTVIEVDAIIQQIQVIISQVSLAIELVLGLILVSGAMVLLASIQASMDERFHQHAILRTLGASQKLVMGSLLIEFCALGLFAGLLATFGTEITVYALQTQIFDLDYSIHPWLWLIGPIIGMLLIGVIGTLATVKVVQTPPITILRDLS